MTKVMSLDGLPIIDAKRSLKLTISKPDIDKANPKEPHNCAIARACRRELRAKEVRVHLSRIYIRTNDTNWQRYATPAGMRDEIIAFDRGGAFAPQEFILPPISTSDAKRMGKRAGGKDKRPRPTTGKKRKPPHTVLDVRTGPAAHS